VSARLVAWNHATSAFIVNDSPLSGSGFGYPQLTELVKPWHENEAEWGFNEWIQAQTGQPSGRDWQTWSAAMYLYAAECVQQERTPFFDEIRAT